MSEQKQPQLMMIREELETLPNIRMMTGYTVRHFQTGDEKHWERIITNSFKSTFHFETHLAAHDYYKPERIWFICYENRPVATATAWFEQKWGKDTGYLHMVGTHSDHLGKGLGLQVSLAALHQMQQQGRKTAVLHTDDFRIPAIKIYLKLGFRPKMIHESHSKRWEKIYNIIDKQ